MIPGDAQIAAVFALGVDTSFVRREDLIAWADREIEARAEPPVWIVELAMSHKTLTLDLHELLLKRADGVTPADALPLAFALVPDPPDGDLAASKRSAAVMYAVACAATRRDYTNPLVLDLMRIEGDLDYYEFSHRSAEELIRVLAEFIRQFRDDEVRARLAPVTWVGNVRT